MNETKQLLERARAQFPPPTDVMDAILRRRDRKRRNQRIAAGVVGIAVALAVALGGASLLRSQPVPADEPQRISPAVPDVDYVIDLDTGQMTPLPDAIIRSLGGSVLSGHYAVSPDGSQLAYTGLGDGGMPQIFIAAIDGTRVHQLTHTSRGATSSAWSPDGTKLAYEGSDNRPSGNGHLFVFDMATRDSTALDLGRIHPETPLGDPQFTPDGFSLLYTFLEGGVPVVKTVPLDGGKSTILFGLGHGDVEHARNASMSPDGSLVTFIDRGIIGPGPRMLANADGSELRRLTIGSCASSPPGTWSSDGSRIVCWEGNSIIVVDVPAETISGVAQGREAIWLDAHTLLVEV
jgi:Tol biopolymer transport system component